VHNLCGVETLLCPDVLFLLQPHDGLGGELLSHLFARARALKFGMFYVYTPISRVQHVNTVSSSTPLRRIIRVGGDPIVTRDREQRIDNDDVMCVQDKGTLEAMESFLNLGADEVDIRTIKSNFTVYNGETAVKHVFGQVRPDPV